MYNKQKKQNFLKAEKIEISEERRMNKVGKEFC